MFGLMLAIYVLTVTGAPTPSFLHAKAMMHDRISQCNYIAQDIISERMAIDFNWAPAPLRTHLERFTQDRVVDALNLFCQIHTTCPLPRAVYFQPA